MARTLIPDGLWELIAPLIPKRPKSPKGGRPPVSDRAALTGIVFVLKTGIQWEDLPQEMGCGSGMTCWRRLRDWQSAGVWQGLHRLLLAKLRAADKIDFSRAIIDSGSVRAVGGGEKNWAQSDRPAQARLQAPRDRRRRRRAARNDRHRRQQA